MTHSANLPTRIAIAAVVGAVTLLWGGDASMNGPLSLVSTAEARIGRPLTPMSYAGVARRTTRRAVAVGAAAGAAAATSCVQVVNAYGQLSTVCR